MSHAVPAPAARRSTWIISPFWDLAFLVGTPVLIVPLMTLLTRRWFTPEQISLVVVSFASLGHHLPGFMRAYGDRELFWRFHWRFLLVPPLVLATALLFAWRDLHGLSLLLLGWSTWHGLMQTYGFMRIYDLKQGRADRWSAELDFALCLAIFVAGVVFSDARVFGISEAMWLAGIPPLDVVWLSATRWLVGAATCAVIGLYVWHLVWSGRGGRGVTWNKVLLAGTTGWLYWVSGLISTNILIGVAMFEVFHAVQYYAIVWVYNRKLADRVGQRFGPLGFLFQHRWTFLLLYLAAIVAFGCIRYFGAEVQQPAFQKLLLAVLTTSTLLHFYYDGFIWKVREAETAANLDIDTSLARWTRLRVPAARHVGKWALFYGLLGLLFWLEAGSQATAARDAQRLATLAAWTPELPELKLRLSAAALERGDPEQAERLAREAVQWRPRSHLAHAALGKALLVAGRYEEAAEALRQAVALQPDQWENVRDLGIAWQRAGQLEEAERQMRRAIRLRPDEAALHWDLGLLLVERRELGGAVDEFQVALAAAPSSVTVRSALVESLSALGRHEQAVEAARQGCRLRPASARAHAALGSALVAAHQFPEAVDVLRRSCQLDPQRIESRFALAVAQLNSGQPEEAAALLREVVQQRPDHVQAYFQLGNTCYLRQDFERAEQHYRRAVELQPDFADGWNNLGAALHCQQRTPEAVAAYQRALQLRPDQGTWHYNLARLWLDQGQRAAAEPHLRRASELGVAVEMEDLPKKF